MKDYKELEYDDLFHIMGEYSNYIQYFYEEHDYPEQQVSIYEFYENEYQDILKENNE